MYPGWMVTLLLTGFCSVSSTIDFHFVTSKMNWDDALLYCSTHYVDLAQLNTNANMAAMMKTPTREYDGLAWIGLFEETNWTWTNGAEAKYSNWDDKEPVNPVQQNSCVMMDHSGKWMSADCTEKKRFICSNGNTFHKETFSVSWDDAKMSCDRMNLALVQINNEKINDVIKKKLGHDSVWIGLSRTTGWYWSESGEGHDFIPTNDDDDNDGCAAVSVKNESWFKQSCTNLLPFYCYSASSTKQTTVRMTIQTRSSNMNDPVTMSNLEHKLRETLKKRGVANFTLSLKSVKKKMQRKASDDC
ncbi:C-type mannose receptor 2-like isoform X2 [Gouania willdenowi]|uniref:C-type mannose receptor 2-like isoform X2 n=1 Tax=Gouania willdenowi TaxID=441366 RepID=UPI0010569FC1|nr:C-type mannose receptor 2-like isoform X2 [Gouania willdenowi]